jgi:hypothetical protein
MKHGRMLFSLLKFGFVVLYLTGCGGIGGINLSNVSLSCTTAQISAAALTITPTVVSVPVGTSVTFSSTEGSGVTSQPTWSFSAIAGTSTDLGKLESDWTSFKHSDVHRTGDAAGLLADWSGAGKGQPAGECDQ